MEFEKVLNGILKYINAEIYSGMNDWQEMLARIAVSRFLKNSSNLKESLIHNPFIKTFAIIDDDGMVDVSGLLSDIKSQLEQKEKICLSIPLLGKFTFTASDVDKLKNCIYGG
jgi:hypothetical protein